MCAYYPDLRHYDTTVFTCMLPPILVHDVLGDTLVSGGDGRVDLHQQQRDDLCHVLLVVTTGVMNVAVLQCT